MLLCFLGVGELWHFYWNEIKLLDSIWSWNDKKIHFWYIVCLEQLKSFGVGKKIRDGWLEVEFINSLLFVDLKLFSKLS